MAGVPFPNLTSFLHDTVGQHHLNPVLVTSQQPTRKQVPPLPSQHTALQLQQIPQSESLPLLPKETFATLSQQSRPQQIQTSQQTLSSHTQQDVPSSPPTPEFLPAPDAMSQLPSEFSAPLHSERSEFIFPDSQYSQSFQPSQPEAESKIIFEPGANLPQQLSLSASHPTPLIPTAVWDPMSRRAPDEPTVYNRSTSLVSQLKVASAKYSAKPRSNRSEYVFIGSTCLYLNLVESGASPVSNGSEFTAIRVRTKIEISRLIGIA